MPALPYMLKHRGFPSRLPGTELQFTLRRAAVCPTKIEERTRRADRKPILHEADANFLACLWEHFGAEPFERGNLDAGRINSLFMKEVIPAEQPFDVMHYEAKLRIDVEAARKSFPEVFESN